MSDDASRASRVTHVVFIALLLDLLAFTLILPLFPRLVAWYLSKSDPSSNDMLRRTLGFLRHARRNILGDTLNKQHDEWDVTLLGGLLGSIFSLCQFIVSPWIGHLADVYGRKPILLMTMVGNIMSNVLWLFSTSYGTFLVSRLVGGLSESNVQLSLLMLADVVEGNEREKARAFAWVGIAFSLAFTFGPLLSATFASKVPVKYQGLNLYAVPAAVAVVLLVIETIYLASSLEETKHFEKSGAKSKAGHVSKKDKLATIRKVSVIHALFTLLFSGAEFTLTFLTYDLFAYSNARNGALLGFTGLLSALISGGYLRRAKRSTASFVQQGIFSAFCCFALLAMAPKMHPDTAKKLVWLSTVFLAFSTATVVHSLNAIASGQCDDSEMELQKGKAMGSMRSYGQLGRAFGPFLACSIYWTFSPAVCYGFLASGMLVVYIISQSLRDAQVPKRTIKTRASTAKLKSH